ncbi:MAG: glutamate formimidoyltransferase [Acidobacteriota bacterium]|nr:MAG: glutamate formimidoyltransferase [Acidobacteriota bacterium]
MKIIECVPNVSEGRDEAVLTAIADAVRSVDAVQLLDMDPGAETNRTVFTFVGSEDGIAEAAFRLVLSATKKIDMRRHRGAHARMGAVDVVPFVPVGGGATMDDCVALARRVGQRLGEELGIPIYLYERAAARDERRSLAEVRKGEYEGLPAKLADPEWKPDFGPTRFVAESGATIVGARPFLIAYNVDLNTPSRKLAHDIALDIREQGRFVRDADGKIVRDDEGRRQRQPGRFNAVRAVGWYIPEFGRAQVSINLTDYHVTAPHVVFEAVREEARRRGLRVTGSEIVGLVPLEAMLMAGRFYAEQQGGVGWLPEPDLVELARISLGLDDVKRFDPQETIIDYRLQKRIDGLRASSLTAFADELSRSSPAPGGGSVAAVCGALGAALASMVAALTHAGANAAERSELAALGLRAQQLKDRLLRAIDEDTDAFEGMRAAGRMPRKTDQQQAEREQALVEATRRAIEVPLSVVEAAKDVAELASEIAEHGLEAAVSDAGVAAWCARAAAESAALNVRINLPGLSNADERGRIEHRLQASLETARQQADKASNMAQRRIG